jgi:hypothetical protein
MDEKTINTFYFSRFIDSLENDIDKWEMTYLGGCDGSSWNEYHGPEYINKKNERIKFALTLNNSGAYINGYMSWTIPFLNPFKFTHRRFVKAVKKMKKRCKIKAELEHNNKLMNAL